MVMSEAKVLLRTARPELEADAMGRYVADIGGYVVSREAERSDDVVRTVEMTLRVPASKFEGAIGELRRHGSVLSESVSGQDVTEDFTDTDAELKSKHRLEDRLLHIVEGSSSVKDMLEVETELTRVRTDIERLEGHSRFLANRVAFATIHATFVSPIQPGVEDGESTTSRLANAFREAGSLFTHVVVGMIVALGAVLPVAVPTGAAFWILRRRRRFREARASR